METTATSLLLILLRATAFVHGVSTLSPPVYDGLPGVNELIENAGFPSTNILVTTEDGYINWMHRLGNNTGPPMLVMHGLLNAADIWLTTGRNQALVYALAMEGYDVYLGNMRGNAISRLHKKYKITDPRYWDFSFHEIGYYDLPAFVDKILELRKTTKLFYLGHSLGTSTFFVMCSARPEYNAKIKAAILHAPVAYIPGPAELSATLVRFAAQMAKTFLNYFPNGIVMEILPRTPAVVRAVQENCGVRSSLQDYCLDFYGQYLGEHRENMDRNMMGYHLSFEFAGTSSKVVIHLLQMIMSNTFRYFDYGRTENLERYNSPEPPDYPLEQVTAPVALFHGLNDNLVSLNTVKKLKARLPNVILDKVCADPKFTHIDIYVGLNAKEMLHNEIIKFLKTLK